MEYKISIACQLSEIIRSKRKHLRETQENIGKKLGVSQRVLSLSMPFTPANLPFTGDVVSNYFDNWLPF